MTAAVPAESSTFAYRPHLDGLRTIAVYLVVLYHAGVDRLSGGFIGVDLFFVLSGYLVTQVLTADLSLSTPGTLRRFYSRRARRLLPAAIVVLASTAVLFTTVAPPAEVREAADSFRAAALYFSNWHFISESTDYFAGDIGTDPVLHFWSLSIEEQFYVVWPLLLVGLFTISRRLKARTPLVPQVAVVAGLLASAWWANHLSAQDLNRAYYGTDTRAYQLLAGAALALLPQLRMRARSGWSRRAVLPLTAIGMTGVVVLASSILSVSPITRGFLATIAMIATLVGLECSPQRTALRTLLSCDQMTYLGKISYGTYLWHWPVVVVIGRTFEISPLYTAVLAVAVSTGMASLSYRFLEEPIRSSRRMHRVPRSIVLCGVGLSAAAGVFVLPAILERDLPGGGREVREQLSSTSFEVTVGSGPASEIDWAAAAEDRAKAVKCFDAPAVQCEVASGDGVRVLVLGDSHAVMLRPTFEAIAERRGFQVTVAARFGCSWHLGLAPQHYSQRQREKCFAVQNDWYDRIVSEVDADLVVLVQRAIDEPDRPLAMVGDSTIAAGSDPTTVLRITAERALDALQALDRRVVIIESIPVVDPSKDPLRCLSQARFIEECRYVARVGPTPLEEFYQSRSGPEVGTINIDRAVCPYLPICDPVVNGIVVKWDDTHLTASYAREISRQVERALEEEGFLPAVPGD